MINGSGSWSSKSMVGVILDLGESSGSATVSSSVGRGRDDMMLFYDNRPSSLEG